METILLSHGEGGRRTRALIREVIARRFGNPFLSPLYDSALLGRLDGEVAFTTDAYVVAPPFFPGGDIGRLAVCGTVNDLAVCGARPLAISCSLILEEGFPLSRFEAVLDSMEAAAREAQVVIACGDTKVVERGKGDGIFVTTSGIGVVADGWRPAPGAVRPGDRVILSGTMGDHHIAVLVARNRLEIAAEVASDVAPLGSMLRDAVETFGPRIRFMRDPTRGGVGVALNEIAESARARFLLEEARLPVAPGVRGVCEILGFDPLFLANEGKALLIVEGGSAEAVVARLARHPHGVGARVVGEVVEGAPGVFLKTAVGAVRAVDYPVGDQLPRIC